jgi:peptidoglycan/LPS O-acetylase OafA/YrhL
LISGIIFRGLIAGDFDFAEFYVRRIRRIVPSLVVVLAATCAIGWAVLLPGEYKELGKHIAASIGFVSNFLLWSEAGYFDASAQFKPLLHLWSLGIEEQFYIVWPLCLWLAYRKKVPFLWVCFGFLLVSFAINIALAGTDGVAAFYSPLSRFWELMVGSVLAYLQLSRRTSAVFAACQAPLGLAAIALAILWLDTTTHYPGWWALLPTLGTALVISAGPGACINRRILGNGALVWIGLVSYPLYLWHWPLLSFARIVHGEALPLIARVGAVAASIVLAWLTYGLIEKPIRFGVRSSLRMATLCTAAGLIGLIGGAIYAQDGLVPAFTEG